MQSIEPHQHKDKTLKSERQHQIMSSMNFSTAKQVVKPPQRGIFPLDHDAECRSKMEVGKSAEVHRMYSESFLEYMAQA